MFINPTLKNFVPILQTYMRDFKGIQSLFTGVYGDVDAIYSMSLLNFPGRLSKEAFERMHYLYNLSSRMVSKKYEKSTFPDQLAIKLEVLPHILHHSERANFKLLFGGDGRDANVAEALIKVAAQ